MTTMVKPAAYQPVVSHGACSACKAVADLGDGLCMGCYDAPEKAMGDAKRRRLYREVRVRRWQRGETTGVIAAALEVSERTVWRVLGKS